MKSRVIIFGCFLFLTINSFSQQTVSAFIEVRGNVDVLGNISLNSISKPRGLSVKDTLIDWSKINLILSLRDPVKVINKLAESGWLLITVTNVTSDKEGRPNNPFLLYYFKKEFTKE